MKFRLLPACALAGVLLCSGVISANGQTSKAGAATAVATSSAPDPTKVPIIEELFRLTKPDMMLQQTLNQYKSAFGDAAQRGFDTEVRKFDDPQKYQGDFNNLKNQLFSVMNTKLDWQKMKPEFVKAYSDSFSTDELSAIAAFYKSPAGKAEIQKMPGVMAKCNAIEQQQMASAVPELQKMMTEFMNGIKQKSQAQKSAPTSKP